MVSGLASALESENLKDLRTRVNACGGRVIAHAEGMSVPLKSVARGFSLVETLVAAGILVTTLAGLAQLVGWSVAHAREAGARSQALSAAQDKLEKLRALSWTVDLGGAPMSHPSLVASPPGSLDTNTSGCVEYLDAAGMVVGRTGAALVRRWAVEPIGSGAPDAIAITVCVFRAPAANTPRAGAEVCVSTARVRQP